MQKNNELQFAFFGTPELTTDILDELKANGYTPKVIITMPDRPIGRKMVITPPPAKVWAVLNTIPVLQPEKLDDEFYGQLSKVNCQLFIVVAYGKIIPEKVIGLPKLGTINIHYSLLPKYRGATPVESAILAGDTETGISIQQMVFALDAGPILKEETLAIMPDETAPELKKRLNARAKLLLVDILPEIISGTAQAKVQDDALATRCGKITKEDGELLATDSDEIKYRKYRAYFGWPGVYYFDQNNKRIKITRATLIDEKFVIERVIPEGKKETEYRE